MNNFALFSTHTYNDLSDKDYDYTKYTFKTMYNYCDKYNIVPHIYHNNFNNSKYDLTNQPQWKYTWSRYFIYQLYAKFNYKKILWLDSDIVITKNLQNVFQKFLQDDGIYICQDIAESLIKHRSSIAENIFFAPILQSVYGLTDLKYKKLYNPAFLLTSFETKQVFNIDNIIDMVKSKPKILQLPGFNDMSQINFNIYNNDIMAYQLDPMLYDLPYMLFVSTPPSLVSPEYKTKQILYNSKVIHFGGIGHHCGGMQYRYKIFMQFVEKYKDLMLL